MLESWKFDTELNLSFLGSSTWVDLSVAGWLAGTSLSCLSKQFPTSGSPRRRTPSLLPSPLTWLGAERRRLVGIGMGVSVIVTANSLTRINSYTNPNNRRFSRRQRAGVSPSERLPERKRRRPSHIQNLYQKNLTPTSGLWRLVSRNGLRYDTKEDRKRHSHIVQT
jgi:hypothetical protein